MALITSVILAWGNVNVSDLRVRDYGTSATRVVLELTTSAYYNIEVSHADHKYNISISNAAISSEIPKLAQGSLLKGIRVLQSTSSAIIELETSRASSHLSMALSAPNRIVIDLFTKSPAGKAERMELAEFFALTGRMSRADGMLENLLKSYPADATVLYKWAEILLKANDKEAAHHKLKQILPEAHNYQAAHNLLTGHTAKAIDPVIDQEPDTSAEPETPPAKPAPVKPLTTSCGFDLSGFICANITYIRYVAGVLALILIIVLLVKSHFFGLFRKQIKTEDFEMNGESTPSEENTCLESETIARMVNRLANDGWKTKEIALELNLSPKEVAKYMQIRSTESADDV